MNTSTSAVEEKEMNISTLLKQQCKNQILHEYHTNMKTVKLESNRSTRISVNMIRECLSINIIFTDYL